MENPNLGHELNEDNNNNNHNSRLKFLCSFNGSILPRPQDGKLRYVGGETRIVSVERDIGFGELMRKMKELFDEASVLKYQQPDEDLDALVSVVNDDDVVNMMEEYEKLGFGDGFTRVRMFLFSGGERDDDSVHFVDNERRYVDALNSHNEAAVDELQPVEPAVNLQSLSHRFSEMEAPWSPAYQGFDRVHQPVYDQQVPLQENVGGFPGNMVHGTFYNMNINTGHTGYPDGNHVASHYVYQEDRPRYIHHGPEFGNEIFHGHANVLWRNGQSPVHGHPSYEALGGPKQENGAYNFGFVRTGMEYSPRVPVGVENQSHHIHLPGEPVQFVPAPAQFIPESAPFTPDLVQFSHEPIQVMSDPVQFTPEIVQLTPEPIESVKKTESSHEVKDEVKESSASVTIKDAKVKEETVEELDVVDATADLELESGNDARSNTKIEPTKAEEEAIARGLQTVKNDDLEEVKELGTGTYGAVYHGKWKGSDVAIKRIKSSCFAGRPSERERLIADFWKEALILSSLHHPNVVSFYGIVRDGPDGSLATVTEFMVNGSLKQFLQKKDRTIDRRKRLIIAMDASFGMEYLHGKNIVHFDLKCENLLVNMRDPHRPICKIGDLGLSKVKQHTLVSGGVRGTLPWMAPELLSGKSNMVSEKIDVYSFGIVMWELLTGDEPYGDMHCASIIGGIVNNSLRPTIPTWCDPEWKALMGSCWSADPAERPSFSEISQKLRNMAAGNNVK